jgi:hypothetical protein
MLCEWGTSRLGPLTFGKREQAIFPGKELRIMHGNFLSDLGRG